MSRIDGMERTGPFCWLYCSSPVTNASLQLPYSSDGKESACNAGDLGSIPGSGTSPGEGNGNPLQYSCLGIPWTEEPDQLQSIGSQSQTRLSPERDDGGLEQGGGEWGGVDGIHRWVGVYTEKRAGGRARDF